jgi:hypothetical protein
MFSILSKQKLMQSKLGLRLDQFYNILVAIIILSFLYLLTPRCNVLLAKFNIKKLFSFLLKQVILEHKKWQKIYWNNAVASYGLSETSQCLSI